MTDDRRRVLCIGRLYCDLIFTEVPRMPTLGTEVYAGGLGLHAGGGAYITAAYLASFGRPTSLSSFIPAAPFGDHVAAEVGMSGVDASLCRSAPPGLDPQVTVSVAASGDRSFLTRRSGAAFPELGPGDLVRLGVAHVHVGELATLVEQSGLIDAVRAAGCTLSVDCAWDEGLRVTGIARLLSAVDVFLPNEAEADRLRDLGLSEPFARLTVVKRGAGGASALTDGKAFHEPARPTAVVDATGAGDAFNAGFLDAWLAGRPLTRCLAAGNATGARAISGRGGFRCHESEPADDKADLVAR